VRLEGLGQLKKKSSTEVVFEVYETSAEIKYCVKCTITKWRLLEVNNYHSVRKQLVDVNSL
jgi:ribosomal protein S26